MAVFRSRGHFILSACRQRAHMLLYIYCFRHANVSPRLAQVDWWFTFVTSFPLDQERGVEHLKEELRQAKGILDQQQSFNSFQRLEAEVRDS